VVVLLQLQECTRLSEKVAAVTCLPFQAVVANWNIERYMSTPVPALPTLACSLRS
jgi:hypothetical protein